MKQAAVEAFELTRKFGDFVAVDRATFSVCRGEIFGFLGSNGAGKTTTIRMLCGLLRPSGGQAAVAGFDVYSQAEQIRRNIGYMSQRFSLYDELTVQENIEFFSGVYGVPSGIRRERIRSVLNRMELLDRRQQRTSLLPGGWKQRLALGCAMVHDPPLLFLDEPTSGVDPVARRNFWDTIYQLSEEGRTVFVTTHYMDEAEYCHRLALMDAGRIIAMDSPRALKQNLREFRFLQLELSDSLEAMRILSEVREVQEVIVSGGGLRLRVRGLEPARTLVMEALSRRGLEVKRLDPVEASMEDVFVSSIETERQKAP